MPIRRNGTGWTAAVTIDDHDVLAELRARVLAAWRDQADRVPLPERGSRARR